MSSNKTPYRFELAPLSFGNEALTLDCALVPWDSDAFGFPVAQITAIKVAADSDGRRAGLALAGMTKWASEQGVRLMSCRLAHDSLVESMLLEGAGFRFIEMVYGMELDRLDKAAFEAPGLEIVPATSTDREALQRIGASAFATGRFNIDPRLDAALGGRRYAGWIGNALISPEQRVVKALQGDRLAGFFIYEDRADGSCYWHLTAVAPECQGQGVGRRLWRGMVMRHRAAGMRRIETTVSARNVPVLNLYAGLGFRFGAPQMTFHWVDT